MAPIPELSMKLTALLFDPDGERVDAALGHEALAEGLEDVLDVALAKGAHRGPLGETVVSYALFVL